MNDISHRNRFIEELMRVFREQGAYKDLSYDAQQFALIIGKPAQVQFILNGCYDEYCQSTPTQREAVLRRWAKNLHDWKQENYSSFEKAKSQLRLRILHHSFATVGPLQARTSAQVPLIRPACAPLAADLAVYIVREDGKRPEYMSADWLATHDVSFEDAVNCALKNRASGCDYTKTRRGKLCVYGSDNGFALAEILVDKTRRHELTDGAAGPVVALVLEQSTLLVAPEDDVTALEQMAAIALRTLPRTYGYGSSQPIVLRDRWEPFTPPEQVEPIFAKLRHALYVARLGAQEVALENYFEQQGSNEQIARVMILQNVHSGGNYLVAVYVPGQTSLVPDVDFLSCVDRTTAKVHHFRWADVRQFAADCLEQTEWPSFWRLTRPPEGPGLHRLTSSELPPALNAA